MNYQKRRCNGPIGFIKGYKKIMTKTIVYSLSFQIFHYRIPYVVYNVKTYESHRIPGKLKH